MVALLICNVKDWQCRHFVEVRDIKMEKFGKSSGSGISTEIYTKIFEIVLFPIRVHPRLIS